jgi:hypothetical protein
MNQLITQDGKLFLSYSYLKEKGIKKKTIEQAIFRKRIAPIKLQSNSFLNFDELPISWKELLPPKNELIALTTSNEFDNILEGYYRHIILLQSKGFGKFRQLYKETYSLNNERSLKASQLHAVWNFILEENQRTGKLEYLFAAFNKLYPKKYSSKYSFANAIKKAKENSIESICIDNRIFSAPKNVKRITADNEYWVSALISLGKKSSNRTVWEKLKTLCLQSNKKTPSKSWVDKYRKQILKTNIDVFTSRYGIQVSTSKKLPYISTIHALRVNDQWQMDGWTLPFWGEKFQRYTVVLIKDAYSKKIIASSCGKSENTLVIMDALKKAIVNTGYLPFEILTDNHSFNQTKEAEYFISEISKYGCKWTVTSNPQHKSIIERGNKYLDTICREYPGYLGSGITSKNIDARPKQEIMDENGKPSNWLTEDEIKLIQIAIIENFNNSRINSSKSPNQIFELADKSHCIQVNLYDRIKLLIPKTEAKISRGQITIKRGNYKHEYQLSAEHFMNYNDDVVVVRYEDLSDCIYVFDKYSDELITELKPKQKIHGAKINQTEYDNKILVQNKGRIEGIKSKARKANEEKTVKALQENPEAIELLNKITTPKNIKEEFEKNSNLRKLAIDEGINIENVHVSTRKNELDNKALKLENRQSKKTPFAPKKHALSKIDLSQLNDE